MVQTDNSTASAKRRPFLGILLSRASLIPIVPMVTSNDEACDSITILQQQDIKYKCEEYLNQNSCSDTDTFNDDTSKDALDNDIDMECREKMIEWCYRVCDCGVFPCDREMVAIAISYLDRFMMKMQMHQSSSSSSSYGCDRPTFKLAAVTAFYLATKIMSCIQIRIESLVDLGRGAFSGDDILQMENQILHQLDWRMNPPTTQCFIRQMWTLLPMTIRKIGSIYYRSIYFAELSVYEYEFVTQDRYIIAVACIFNALLSEQIDVNVFETTNQMNVLYDLLTMSKNTQERKGTLRRIQCRLWYLYSCSAQVSVDIEQLDTTVVLPRYKPLRIRNGCDDAIVSLSSRHSPVSVQGDGNNA